MADAGFLVMRGEVHAAEAGGCVGPLDAVDWQPY